MVKGFWEIERAGKGIEKKLKMKKKRVLETTMGNKTM